ncbi:hypothetical protein [Chryseobacterium luteum]|nr:hypothetical protein [Chryseobacterium luteum]
MKKHIYLLLTVFLNGIMYSQVGINNSDPKATMDITANAGSNRAQGLILPRLTGDQIKLKNGQYGTDQNGTLIYATSGISSPDSTGKTSNITSAGYYYFNSVVWEKVISGKGVYDSSDDAWINDPSNSMVKLGSQSDGVTSRAAETNFVALDNGNIGIGTTSPSAKLQINNTSTNISSIKVNGISNQPSSSNSAYLTVDNVTGEFYKGLQSEKAFYYQKYNLNNVSGDWVNNFDTKINAANYTLIIVGSYFSKLLGVNNTNTSTSRFTPQNVFAFKENGTWRISADFPTTSSVGDSGGALVNGDWTIYTMVIRNNQVVNNADVTINMQSSSNGSASVTPVP